MPKESKEQSELRPRWDRKNSNPAQPKLFRFLFLLIIIVILLLVGLYFTNYFGFKIWADSYVSENWDKIGTALTGNAITGEAVIDVSSPSGENIYISFFQDNLLYLILGLVLLFLIWVIIYAHHKISRFAEQTDLELESISRLKPTESSRKLSWLRGRTKVKTDIKLKLLKTTLAIPKTVPPPIKKIKQKWNLFQPKSKIEPTAKTEPKWNLFKTKPKTKSTPPIKKTEPKWNLFRTKPKTESIPPTKKTKPKWNLFKPKPKIEPTPISEFKPSPKTLKLFTEKMLVSVKEKTEPKPVKKAKAIVKKAKSKNTKTKKSKTKKQLHHQVMPPHLSQNLPKKTFKARPIIKAASKIKSQSAPKETKDMELDRIEREISKLRQEISQND
ncbi:MAG TPA: hypothetical protein VJC39_00700 [Candidatus Nanoarchaeia archaeon]|nr:hypothetical protein [Candidatus Nanoarchaeia archaeon]